MISMRGEKLMIGMRGGSEFSSYEAELRKMTPYFELLTRKYFQKFFFRVTNSTLSNIKLNFELLTRGINFYFFPFE